MFDPDLLLERLTQLRTGDYVTYDEMRQMCDGLAAHIAGVPGALIEKRIALFLFEMTDVIRDRREAEVDKGYINEIEAIWLRFAVTATEDFWDA